MVTKDEIIKELKQQQKCLTHKNMLVYCDLCLKEQLQEAKKEVIDDIKYCNQKEYNNDANKKKMIM